MAQPKSSTIDENRPTIPPYQPCAKEGHCRKPARPPDLIRDSYSVQLGFQEIVVPHQAFIITSFTPRHPSQRRIVACRGRVVEVSYVSKLPISKSNLGQTYVRAKARGIKFQCTVKTLGRALEVQPLKERLADSFEQIRFIAR